jgi:uncharacterized membrane protein YqjE
LERFFSHAASQVLEKRDFFLAIYKELLFFCNFLASFGFYIFRQPGFIAFGCAGLQVCTVLLFQSLERMKGVCSLLLVFVSLSLTLAGTDWDLIKSINNNPKSSWVAGENERYF